MHILHKLTCPALGVLLLPPHLCPAAVCAALAFSDFSGRGLKPCPQQQQQQHWGSSSSSGFRGTGWLCMCSALLYMWTGMAGLSSYALPTNPGEAFKMVDVAQRHKVG
jgi:hypothetical protein